MTDNEVLSGILQAADGVSKGHNQASQDLWIEGTSGFSMKAILSMLKRIYEEC